jgi:folate-binding protein YgfZ
MLQLATRLHIRSCFAAFSFYGRRYITIPTSIPSKGLINLTESSRFLEITGKDASTFINGLTTVKMLPKHLKKNQTTISEADINNSKIVESINLSEELITTSNWGILHENEEFSPTDPEELPMRLGVRRDGRYGLILKANGRVFTDIFIYPTPFLPITLESSTTPSYIIEVMNKEQFKPLLMTLKLHKLRSQVDIKELNANAWFYYDDTDRGIEVYDSLLDQYFANANSKSPESAASLVTLFFQNEVLFDKKVDKSNVLGLAIDQRSDYFGVRILYKTSEIPPIKDIDEKTTMLPYETYITRRVKNGIVETSDFQSTASLPFECNLDWMHGINYEKGCYMGQELTIRTWTGNGTVRRVLPIKFDTPVPVIDDAFERFELKAIESDKKKEEGEAAVYNPFGQSISDTAPKPVRSRRDMSKVGELLVTNGVEGLAKVEKRYFDWDTEEIKKVKVVVRDQVYIATIDTSLWN